MADPTDFLRNLSQDLGGNAGLISTIASQYPALLPYMSDPEIAKIILDGASKHQTPTQFQGAVQASQWYRTKPPSERQWINTKLIDPARAAQLEASSTVQVRQIAASYGVPLTSQQVDLFTQGALQGGWDAAEIQRRVVDQVNQSRLHPGQILATQNQLKATASTYAVPLSTNALQSWARQINDGSQTTQGFQSYMQDQATKAYPPLAKQIASGLTVKQIGDPYAQIAGNLLGIDPATVDWSQPKWQAALQSRDKDGNITGPLDHLAWQKKIVTDPTYGYSRSAQGQTDAYDLVNSLKKQMGVQA